MLDYQQDSLILCESVVGSSGHNPTPHKIGDLVGPRYFVLKNKNMSAFFFFFFFCIRKIYLADSFLVSEHLFTDILDLAHGSGRIFYFTHFFFKVNNGR